MPQKIFPLSLGLNIKIYLCQSARNSEISSEKHIHQQSHINKAIDLALPTKKNKPVLSEAQIANIKRISEVVLAVIAVAGVLTLVAVVPNIFVAIDGVAKSLKSRKNWSKEEKKEKVKRAFYYLKESGLIRLSQGNGKITLTEKGKSKLKQIAVQSTSVPKGKAWNGKWWLVAADIPTEQYRFAADLFRKKLKDMGFYALQRTLWLYPFDPQSEIQFVAQHYGIEKYVTVMEINRLDIDDEKNLKTFFQSRKII